MEVKHPRVEVAQLVVVVLRGQHLALGAGKSQREAYCSVELTSSGEALKRTKLDRGGQEPVWDEEFRYRVYELDGAEQPFPLLKLTVHARRDETEQTESEPEDELIGQAAILVSGKWKDNEFDDWVEVKQNGQYKGEIFLEMTYYPAMKTARPLQRRPSKIDPQIRIQRGPILPLPADNPSGRFVPVPRPRPQSQLPGIIPTPSNRSSMQLPVSGGPGPVAKKGPTAQAFRAPKPAPLPLPGDPEPPEIPAFLRPGRPQAPLDTKSVAPPTEVRDEHTNTSNPNPRSSSLPQITVSGEAISSAASSDAAILAPTQPFGHTAAVILPPAQRQDQLDQVETAPSAQTQHPGSRTLIQVHSDPLVPQVKLDEDMPRPSLPPPTRSSPDVPQSQAPQHLPPTEHMVPQRPPPANVSYGQLFELGHSERQLQPAMIRGPQPTHAQQGANTSPVQWVSPVPDGRAPLHAVPAGWQYASPSPALTGSQYHQSTSTTQPVSDVSPRQPAYRQSAYAPLSNRASFVQSPAPQPPHPSRTSEAVDARFSAAVSSEYPRRTTSHEYTHEMSGAFITTRDPGPPLPPKTPLSPPPLPPTPDRRRSSSREMASLAASGAGSRSRSPGVGAGGGSTHTLTKVEEFERERAAARAREAQANESHMERPWADAPPLYSATDSSGKGKSKASAADSLEESPRSYNARSTSPRESMSIGTNDAGNRTSSSSIAVDRIHAGQAALVRRIKQEQEDARMAAQLAKEVEERDKQERLERERQADQELAAFMRLEEERQRQREREDEEMAQRMAEEATSEEEVLRARVEADERLARSLAEHEQTPT